MPLVLAATPSFAQVSGTVDIGAGSVDYDDVPTLAVYSITPRLAFTDGWATLLVSGTFSRFDNEGWGSRMVAAFSFLTPEYRGLRAEFSGRGESQANRVTTRAGYGEGRVRIHYSGTRGGVWVGAGSARVWDGGFWQASARSETGLWFQEGVVGLRGSMRRAEYRPGSRRADRLTYQTIEAALTIGDASYQFEGTVGRRYGENFEATTTWSAAAAYWLSRFVALSAAAGRYAVDPAQGLPGGNYVSLGMRLAPSSFFRSTPTRRRARTSEDAVRFEVVVVPTGRRVFRYVGQAVRSVQIIGSFSDWRPLDLLETSPGVWELTIALSPGSYFVNIRIDEGEWIVPPGVTVVEDDFNGSVGLVIVPR
ncbi:MAG: glycogen-binding domain-containing protein [Gemmatimonadales bacterium]